MEPFYFSYPLCISVYESAKCKSYASNITRHRTVTPIPCPQCVDVVFCSKTCRNAAIYGYHKFECGLLETIWKSGSSINCHMAMRLISQRPLSYFKSIQDQLIDNLGFDDIKKLVNMEKTKFIHCEIQIQVVN